MKSLKLKIMLVLGVNIFCFFLVSSKTSTTTTKSSTGQSKSESTSSSASSKQSETTKTQETATNSASTAAASSTASAAAASTTAEAVGKSETSISRGASTTSMRSAEGSLNRESMSGSRSFQSRNNSERSNNLSQQESRTSHQRSGAIGQAVGTNEPAPVADKPKHSKENNMSEATSNSEQPVVQTPADNTQNTADNSQPAPAEPDQSLDQQDQQEAADTLKLSEAEIGFRGNWEKKKKWLISARNRNSKMQILITDIQNTREPFQKTFFDLDKEFDTFWNETGLHESKLDDLFAGLEKYMEEQQKEKIGHILTKEEEGEYLTPQETELKEKNQTEFDEFKKQYDQFKDDLKAIPALKSGIVDRLKKLDEVISQAISAANDGRAKYEEIWDILDHTKAEAFYADVKNAWNKVKNLYDYIKDEFTTNFNSSVDIVKSHLSKVRDEIKTLEDKGLIIKNRFEKIDQLKKEQKELEIEQENKRKAAVIARAAATKSNFISKTYNSTKEFLGTLYGEILKLFSFKGSSEPSAKPAKK